MDHGYHGNAVFCSDSGTEIDNVLIIFCKTIHWFVNMSNTLILYKDITTKHIGYPTQPSPNPKIGGLPVSDVTGIGDSDVITLCARVS